MRKRLPFETIRVSIDEEPAEYFVTCDQAVLYVQQLMLLPTQTAYIDKLDPTGSMTQSTLFTRRGNGPLVRSE